MTIRSNLLFVLAVSVFMTACNGGKTQNSEKNTEQKKAEQAFQALPFPDVQVPSMLSDRVQVFEHMAENYWNGITDPSRRYPSDSLYVSGVDKNVVEQKFADWTRVLDEVPLDVALVSVGNLCERALACERRDSSSNVLETFVRLADKYFYDPNSPMRNEEYYLPFVTRYASYEGLSEVERKKYEREARLCALNRIGTKATDFRFCDRYGKIRNLHGIEADLILLFFSNPGCNACMDIINALKDETIVTMIDRGQMQILNIYIDEDIQAWRSYMPIYPEQWYNGFDPDFVLKGDQMYNIRAIPSLYLLDKEKNVLMKDVPPEVLFMYLKSVCDTGMESYQ